MYYFACFFLIHVQKKCTCSTSLVLRKILSVSIAMSIITLLHDFCDTWVRSPYVIIRAEIVLFILDLVSKVTVLYNYKLS
jgi:hypothetical protein